MRVDTEGRRRRGWGGARRGTIVAALGLVSILVGLAQAATAQIGVAAVAGRIVDRAGAPLPGVAVTAVEATTRLTRDAQSDADGAYALVALPPGTYALTFRATGFRTLRRPGVALTTGETSRVDATLDLGMADEEIAVIADLAAHRDTAGLGHVVENPSMTALPLNGRQFISLASLAPGVAVPPGSSLPRINGGRPRTNEYLFDGISVLQPEPGQVAFFPNVDAIREFRIESNSPPAEFGRFNGGVVNLTTKSGTNQWHGSGFEFFRDAALNARNPFAVGVSEKPVFRRDQFGGVLGGPLRRDRTFFFLDYQGQRQRIGRTVISTVPTLLQRQGVFSEPIGGQVPTIYDPATSEVSEAGVSRAPFPGNAVPADRFDPVARALIARYPLPTDPGTANNFRRVGDERVDQDLYSLRIDHQATLTGNRLFGRLTRFRETSLPVTPLPDGSGVTTGTPGPQTTGAWAFASAYQRVFSARVLNELRVGDTRRSVRRRAATLAASPSDVIGLRGLPAGAQFADTLPTFLIAGYQQLGSPPNTATRFATSVTQVADSLTLVAGRHTLKMGADLRWSRLDVVQPPSPAGRFSFSSTFTDFPGVPGTGTPLASFLLGQVQQFSVDLQQRPIRNRAHVQEYFVQDRWQVTPRATIDAGIRYTLNFPSTEVDDQAAVFNLQTRQLEYLGRDGHPRAARRLHKTNFGPRLSVALRASDRLTLRTGYGLVWIEQAGITTPFTTPAFPFLQTVSQRTLDGVTPAFALAEGPSVEPVSLTPSAGLGQGVFAVDRGLGSGYVQQWHAAVQRDLGAGWLVEAAVVGSAITRVGLPDSNLNQLSVEQLAAGPALLQRVPNPYFGVIPRASSLGDPTIPVAQLLKPYPQHTTVSLYRNNVGTTAYRGVTLKLERRFTRGLSLLGAYTRSRLVDDASSVFDASVLTGPVANAPVADSFDRQRERDYSTGDIPHVFVASAVWESPFGAGKARRASGPAGLLLNDWTLSGLLTLQSGMPIAVTQATNANAFAGFGTQRPNLLRDPRLPADERSTARWFDTGAFAAAPQFTLGNSSRNPVRGPGYRNLDVAVARRLPLGPTRTLELRMEVFNVTNTPALGAPSGVFGSAAFGSITSAGDPRVVQLAVRVQF